MKNKLFISFSKYVSLNILGMLGLSCYILADTYMIANGIGEKGIAALNLSISIYSIIHGTGLMIGIGGATKYNIQRSSGEVKEVNKTFTATTQLGIIMGFIYFIVGMLFSKSLARILGGQKDVLIMSATYIKTILSFSPFFIMNNIFIAFIRNDGGPKVSMIGMLIGSLSNIILDYIYIFILDLGMFGAAFATGLAPIFSMLSMSIYFIKKKNKFYIEKSKLKYSLIINIFRLGISSFITEIASGITLIVFNLLFIKFSGNTALAAYGIVANIALVAVAVFTGIGQGVQPLISHYYGKGKINKVEEILKYSLFLSIILSIFLYAIIIIFGEDIVSLFNKDKNVILKNYALNGMYIYFIGFLFAGVNIILSFYFSAIEKSKSGFYIAILRGLLIIVPLSFVLTIMFGIEGIWMTFFITEMLVLIIAIIMKSKYKNTII